MNKWDAYFEFLSSYQTEEHEDDIDFNIIQQYTFERRCWDIWGEADKLLRIKSRSDDSCDKQSKIVRQLKMLNMTCHRVYDDGALSPHLKKCVRSVEWELKDFVLGDNLFEHDEQTVMKWLDERLYQRV